MADLFKQYLGANYKKAKNINLERAKFITLFIKQYPYADLCLFEFDMDIDKEGNINGTAGAMFEI